MSHDYLDSWHTIMFSTMDINEEAHLAYTLSCYSLVQVVAVISVAQHVLIMRPI